MSNWKSCKEGAVGRFERRTDVTHSMNEWAGRGCVDSGVERGGPEGAFKPSVGAFKPGVGAFKPSAIVLISHEDPCGERNKSDTSSIETKSSPVVANP